MIDLTKRTKNIISCSIVIFITLLISGCGTLDSVSMPGIMYSNPAKLKAEAIEVIKQSAVSNDAYVRTYAMEALAEANCDGCDTLIQQALSDSTVSVKVAAAIASGDMHIQQTKDTLEVMLRSKEPMIQLAAGYALEKMGIKEERFARWYDKALLSANERYAGQSCMLIGKLGETPLRRNSKDKLWTVMKKNDQKPYIRLQAAEALARMGDIRVTERLLDFAGSSYADDRLLVVSSLKLLGSQECYAMLSVLAADEQIEVSLSALRSLGALAGKDDVVPAYKALEYKDPYNDKNTTQRVRHLAILAIGSFGNEMDQSILKRYLSDDSELIRLTAAVATINWEKVISSKYTP